MAVKEILTLQRYSALLAAIVLTVICLIGSLWAGWLFVPFLIFAALAALGLRDISQDRHAITRNYPIIGHFRFLFEKIRPEIRQYLIEGDKDEMPFSREARSLVYQRSKGDEDKRPFGTQENVY